MIPLRTLIPDVSSLLALSTADLAGYVFESLMSAGHSDSGMWNRRNFCSYAMSEYSTAGQSKDMQVGIACSAAWLWIEVNGLICKHPEDGSDWSMATQLGIALGNRHEVKQLVSL